MSNMKKLTEGEEEGEGVKGGEGGEGGGGEYFSILILSAATASFFVACLLGN